MKISKTKIEKRLKQKRNPVLVETLIRLKKKNPVAAKALARPNKKLVNINLVDINKIGKDIIVAGKVLSLGNLEKKIKIVALGASKKAIEKIKLGGGKFILVADEIKKNPELKGLELVK